MVTLEVWALVARLPKAHNPVGWATGFRNWCLAYYCCLYKRVLHMAQLGQLGSYYGIALSAFLGMGGCSLVTYVAKARNMVSGTLLVTG